MLTVVSDFTLRGTTLIAAKNLGIPAVGIDIEEEHCETAVNRLRQESLFTATHNKALQTTKPARGGYSQMVLPQ